MRRLSILVSVVVLIMGAQHALAGSPTPPPPPTTPFIAHQAYLKASNTEANDFFGYAVGLDGDTAVIGSTTEGGSGAAYVYVRNAGGWSQQQLLKASNAESSDAFGYSVAVSADTVVVGAPFESSGADGVGGNQADNSASFAGAVYVFTRSGGVWTQQEYVKASNSAFDDRFGESVAISADTMVVGALHEDSNATTVGGDEANDLAENAGAAYVFTRSGVIWSQQAYVKPGNAGLGDKFGWSVDVDGDTLVVGAPLEDGSSKTINGPYDELAFDAGATYVFTRSGGVWSPQAYLKASNAGSPDNFGESVAISGDTVVASAPREASNATGVDGIQTNNSMFASGAAYAFTRSGVTWSQQAYLKASNTTTDDNFGRWVDIDGNLLVVGAWSEDSHATGVDGPEWTNSAVNSGAVYLFSRLGSVWGQIAYIKATNTEAGDAFGEATAVSGSTVLVSAPGEDSVATGVNGDQLSNDAQNSGAAYVLDEPCFSAPFSDVSTAHTFCAEIEWMRQTAISTGFGDGTYRPTDSVSRQAMSAFMARLAGVADTLPECSTQPFSDVPVGHPFCPEIKWMKDEGIATGFGDQTFRPSLAVSRQAMSAFLARLAGAVSLPACTSPPFNDVAASHPFCKEIKWMKDTEISLGFGDGSYRPVANVTRQAMSAFLFRVRVFVP